MHLRSHTRAAIDAVPLPQLRRASASIRAHPLVTPDVIELVLNGGNGTVCTATIGANKNSETPLGRYPQLSPEHLHIRVLGSRCFVTDLKSTSGTFVSQALLPTGQEVELTQLEVVSLGDAHLCPPRSGDTSKPYINPFSYTFHSSSEIEQEMAMDDMRGTLKKAEEGVRLNETGVLLKDNLECSICLGLFITPCVLGGCSHKFCYLCISKWIESQKCETCPLCRAGLVIARGRSAPLLNVCRTTERLFQVLVEPHFSSELRELRKRLSDNSTFQMKLAMHQDSSRPIYPMRNLSIAHIGDLVPTAPIIASSSVGRDVLCISCLKAIPRGFARIICHAGLQEEAHLHASYPCCDAAMMQVHMYGNLRFASQGLDRLNSQELFAVTRVFTRFNFGRK